MYTSRWYCTVRGERANTSTAAAAAGRLTCSLRASTYSRAAEATANTTIASRAAPTAVACRTQAPVASVYRAIWIHPSGGWSYQ